MYIIIAIACIILSGVLWHLGGQGHKWARSFGVPTVITATKLLIVLQQLGKTGWWCVCYAPLLWLMMAGFSYGLTAPPHKFWVWVFGTGDDGSVWYVELATRLTCGFFWTLSAIVFALVTGHWLPFIAYLIAGTISIGALGLEKDVRISEIGTGASVALCVII